ncbi:MAG: hypothetical protein ABIS45_17685, partial [Burkholderiales bacterium]
KLQHETELQIAREEAETRMRAEFRVLEANIRQSREEAQAREDVERKARQEAESRIAAERKAREEAEARAATEIAAREEEVRKARVEAESRAAAEAKAREEFAVERKARTDAEAQIAVERQSRDEAVSNARAEAEQRARAEVEARIASERKAHDDADARVAAAREEAESKAQAELETRIDAERKAREEAERKREQAEAQAEAALQISAAAEKLIREAASKETAVAEKSRDEAQKMRDEAQRMLDAARLQHEQAVAKAQAEMMARVHAEQKAVAEKRARAAAEDRAKQETVARVMQEHQMRQNAEKEIEAKVEAEIRARSQADFDSDVKARADAQIRADAAAMQRSMEKDNAASRGVSSAVARRPVKWGSLLLTGLIILLLAGVAILQVAPMNGYIPGAEKVLSERLQEPVSIGGLRFTLFPTPQLKLEHIAIGAAQDVKVDSATIDVTSTAIFDEHTKDINEIELSGVVIEQDALPRLIAWSKAPAAASRLQLQHIKINAIKLALHGVEMPSLDAVITLDKDGGWQKLSVKDSKANLELTPLKEPGEMRATFTASAWTPPAGLTVEFSELAATATIRRGQATITGIEGRVFGGAFKGDAVLKWNSGLAADGELSFKNADVAQVLAGFTNNFMASGVLDTVMKFSTQGQTPDELFAAPRVTATFTLQKGTLNNLDLVRAIQSTSRAGLRGGRTPYSEISGEAQSAANRISYRNLKLTAGPLNAHGAVDVSPAGELAGRLNVQLGTQGVSIARGTLNVSGGMKDPVLSQ